MVGLLGRKMQIENNAYRWLVTDKVTKNAILQIKKTEYSNAEYDINKEIVCQ